MIFLTIQSFDDESLDTRRRSSLQMEFGSNIDVQGCKLTPTSSIEGTDTSLIATPTLI